jgi:CRP-like cAMP-binding protein
MPVRKPIPSNPKSLAKLLKQCDLFAGLTALQLEGVAKVAQKRLVKSGSEVFREGEPCRMLYFVAQGRVKLSKVSLGGKEQILRLVPAGQAFGGAPIFARQGSYPATAVAMEDCQMVQVTKPGLLGLIQRQPGIAVALLETIASHQMEMMKLVQGLSLERVELRLARLILEAAHAQKGPYQGQVLVLAPTQNELAARLGTVREVLWRELKHLQASGVLEFKGRRVVLKDTHALEKAAEGGLGA